MMKGFTLVELLIVIAIISIVAALLFPVFAAAKSASNQALCTSNLRQLGMGVNLYENDLDDQLPWSYSWDDNSIWATAVNPYIHAYFKNSAGLWSCPVSGTFGQAYATNCQVIGMIDTRTQMPIETAFETTLNSSVLQTPSSTILAGDAIVSALVTSDRLQDAPRSPDDFAFPHPANAANHTGDTFWAGYWLDLPFNDKQISYRHTEGASFVYTDLHVRRRVLDSLRDDNWDVRCAYGERCDGASSSPIYAAPNGSCGNQSPINCQ
jgi:prepilin-type N-terminal cleavage/methylation domain-containing protein